VGADTPVISCYEAGLDGFWVHRHLISAGVQNVVVDSSSIEVNRRARRAKTDRLDVERRLALLLRYVGGERSALWDDEDRRDGIGRRMYRLTVRGETATPNFSSSSAAIRSSQV